MRAPSADELAAIAAAFLVIDRRGDAMTKPPEASRWALAARLPANDDVASARFVTRAASRWNAAGRLDG